MPKYRVDITANDADSAENLLKVVHTAVETNPSLNIESVKVEPNPDTQQPFQGEAVYERGVKQ